jgi:hypothetical protein
LEIVISDFIVLKLSERKEEYDTDDVDVNQLSDKTISEKRYDPK